MYIVLWKTTTGHENNFVELVFKRTSREYNYSYLITSDVSIGNIIIFNHVCHCQNKKIISRKPIGTQYYSIIYIY